MIYRKKLTLVSSAALYIFISLFVFLNGCSQVQNTDDINADLLNIKRKISRAEEESAKYTGGVIKILIEQRKEILSYTKTMLEQKKIGINRFIDIKYTVDGEIFKQPKDYEKIINDIDTEILMIRAEIEEFQKESDLYSGGLIKVMIEMKIATAATSLGFLEQKKLSLKYSFPIYISPDLSESNNEKERIKMEGSDLDNL
ncbi:MAG: hypothetical protein GY853_06090 [PVC group bacterium]|nr:hypothetical protein [PVC group bacterium]